MKAYITSIGEKTTAICVQQLILFGFEIVLLDKVEPWIEKYKRFINMAHEPCVRVDADIIVNEKIKLVTAETLGTPLKMIQFRNYEFYRNDIAVGQPVWYSAEALRLIRKHWNELGDKKRPEASAWRLRQINSFTKTSDIIVGMNGFFQDDEHLTRHEKHKKERHQDHEYDFELAKKLKAL